MPRHRGRPYPEMAALLLYAVLLSGSVAGGGSLLLALLIAPFLYFLAMYLYYGLARLTFQRLHPWLLGGTGLAVGLNLVLTGFSGVWMTLVEWCVLLLTAVAAGRMTLHGYRPRTIYIVSLTIMMFLVTAQYLPVWQQAAGSAAEQTEALVAEAERQLSVLGEGPARTQMLLTAFRRLTEFLLRMIPAEMLLGVAVQFSIGYLLFIRWIGRHHLAAPQWEPFIYWQMPFGLAPLLLAILVTRLVGGATLEVVADNALAVLATFYAVVGLAVIEYGFRKIQLSLAMRILFYIMLAVFPLISLSAALILSVVICLLGFVDSFADWRKVRLRELA